MRGAAKEASTEETIAKKREEGRGCRLFTQSVAPRLLIDKGPVLLQKPMRAILMCRPNSWGLLKPGNGTNFINLYYVGSESMNGLRSNTERKTGR